MAEPSFDHDRLDVYRLSIEYVSEYLVEVDHEHEYRGAEHEHETKKESELGMTIAMQRYVS